MKSFEIEPALAAAEAAMIAGKARLAAHVASVVGTAAALAALTTSHAEVIAAIETMPGTAPDYSGSSQWEAMLQDKLAKLTADYVPLRNDGNSFAIEAQAHTEF